MKTKFIAILLLNLFVQSSYGAFLPIAHQLVNRQPLPPRILPPPPIRPVPVPPLQPVEPVIEMELPTFAGTGCPQGTLSAVLSPDKTTLTVLFDQFIVESGPSSLKKFDVKNCNLKIPLRTTNGRYSAKIVSVDYRGTAVLPQGSFLQVVLQDALLSGRGAGLIMNRERFLGPFNDDFLIHVESQPDVTPNKHQWSVCDLRQELNLNARLELQNSSTQDALASMDSIDVSTKASISYRLAWRQCLR